MEGIKNTPWKVERKNGALVVNAKNERIADCNIFLLNGKRKDEDNEANARLIAVAPDMIGLLMLIAEKDLLQINTQHDKEELQSVLTSMQEVLQKVRVQS